MPSLLQRLQRLRASLSGRAVEKAAVAPTTLPAELVGTGGWLSSIAALSHGYVHEPFAGAWQRNVADAAHPSIIAFSAVYACVSIISSDIAKLPLRIMRALPSGGREPHPNHPIDRLLWTPNEYQTRVDFVQQLVASTLLDGNAYVFKERDNRGVESALHVLDPRRVQTLVAETGDVFYQVGRNKLASLNDADSVVIPARDIIHHRLMCLDHPLVGVTPLFAAGSSAQVGARIVMQGNRFFANQSRPAGILVAPGRINAETARLLKEEWESNFSGNNAGRTAVLGDGLKWEPLVMTAQDAQLIEQLRWSVEDVARVFRVPIFLLGDLSKVTYRNSEQMARHYYSGCLQYHIEALEARFDHAFGLRSDVYIEFDLEPLLRTEMDVRFAAYQQSIQSGFATINEVRAKEGAAPIPGGDEPLVQMQYIPLSQIGRQPEPAAPAAAQSTDGPAEDDEDAEPEAEEEEQAPVNPDRMAGLMDQAIARTWGTA